MLTPNVTSQVLKDLAWILDHHLDVVVHADQCVKTGAVDMALTSLHGGGGQVDVIWRTNVMDGHDILRDITYHFLITNAEGELRLPLVVVHRFSDILRRVLAFEGRKLMNKKLSREWLIASIEGRELIGYFEGREIGNLPRAG